ncbi:hypothetical protein O6R05_06930 [Peptoniphilus equinus]|uniref:Copper amine oxidase N-terminal domain-containing protein n=1 Tax=Peptoniphilus equinus TaxID=3016343 RepID=A0ABY7QSG3_9FIRM|nr:hypothetical protein [Peptoniphilus equinus]WBW49730.1 hypothetical protein O6R05_06930 [Peptoniphilus equinus]
MLKHIGAVIALALALATPVSATTLQVTLPDYPIEINGYTIDPKINKYPPLAYRGVTYIPMTYRNAEFLGIHTEWDNANRILKIERGVASSGWQLYPFPTESPNNRREQVQTAPFQVLINGKAIDDKDLNAYPFFVFRDVTYLPMTWRIFHDELDYNWTFSSENGLVMRAENYTLSKVGGVDSIGYDGGFIDFAPFPPSSYFFDNVTEDSRQHFDLDLRERYFKGFQGFRAPGTMGYYYITPDQHVEAKPYVQGDVLYMPFGYATDYTLSEKNSKLTFNSTAVRNVILKYNIHTGELLGEEEVPMTKVQELSKEQ